MKGKGFLTIIGCGLLAAFLLSLTGPAVSAAPGRGETAVSENEAETADEEEGRQKDGAEREKTAEDSEAISENAASEASVSRNMASRKTVSQNSVSGNTVSGDSVSSNRIPARLLLRPSGGRRTDVSRNVISGNSISQNTVSGNAVSANTVSGSSVAQNTVSEKTSSVSEVSTGSVSRNHASGDGTAEEKRPENRVSGSSVSGNQVSGNSTSGSKASGSRVSGNSTSGNSVSQNSVSRNNVSRNSVSANSVSQNAAPEMVHDRKLTLEDRQKVMSSHKQTMQANEQDRKTISGNDIDFSDLKIACIGDSITQAVNLESLENYQELAWPHIMQEALGAGEVVNLGIGGSSIGRYWADAFVDRYDQIPEDTDLILVMGGTNDGFCASFVEFGNSAERAPRTFWGDLDELMDGLAADYPDAEVIFMTPLPNSLQDILKAERKYLMPQEKFGEVISTLAGEHGMEVFDLYNSNILDGHDKDNVLHLMPDGVHPNAEGYRILGEHIAAELIRLLDERKEQMPEWNGQSEDWEEPEESGTSEDWEEPEESETSEEQEVPEESGTSEEQEVPEESQTSEEQESRREAR